MKIAIISPAFGFGGSNIVAKTVGDALASEHEVFYVAYQQDNPDFSAPHYVFLDSKRSLFERVLRPLSNAWALWVQHRFDPAASRKQSLKRLINFVNDNQIDAVILNSFDTSVFFARGLKLALPQLMVIGWFHEAVDWIQSLTRKYPVAFHQSLATLDKAVCLTHETATYYAQWQPKTKVIYNPVQLAKHGRADLKLHTISFVARLDSQIKGLDYLVELAKRLPSSWVIKAAGMGTDEETRRFQELIKQNHVEDTLLFEGAKRGKALANHYQNSSLFISTSRTEALPLVMIEAMSFGLPIVSFAHSGAREILQDGAVGRLIPVGNIDAMARSIQEIADSVHTREEMGRLSAERYRDFAIEPIKEQWLAALKG